MTETLQFQVRLRQREISKEELLIDLKRVAVELDSKSVTKGQYRLHGNFSHSTISKYLGSWNLALGAAELSIGHRMGIPDEEFFSNIAVVWTALGRQPTSKDMSDRTTGSAFPIGSYKRRFGTWNAALIAFSQFINSEDDRKTTYTLEPESALRIDPDKRRSPRDIGWRLRVKVLIRNSCICQMCGDSPAKNPETVLHVDHILAWANGGETVEENLQTLCAVCNIGKSDQLLPGQEKTS